jgi:hypothetical protein
MESRVKMVALNLGNTVIAENRTKTGITCGTQSVVRYSTYEASDTLANMTTDQEQLSGGNVFGYEEVV